MSAHEVSSSVLITGASQGLGLEMARQYAARQWRVIATHRRPATPFSLLQLAQKYPALQVERMDVTNHLQIDSLAERLRGEPIDLLLNNAGVTRLAPLKDPHGNAGQSFGTLDYSHFDNFMRTNVGGVLKVAEAFVENLSASRQRKLVAISSAAGMVSVLPQSADHYWYRISKTALNSAMRLLTVELRARGVTVVMLHPGTVVVGSYGEYRPPSCMTPEKAVATLMPVIDRLVITDSGRFLRNDGSDQPW